MVDALGNPVGFFLTGGQAHDLVGADQLVPPYAPELNAMENVWDYLRANKLSSLVWDSYDAIVQASKNAWNFLAEDPMRIASIGHRQWACVRS